MKFVQNFNLTTLVVTQRELVFLNLKIFFFWYPFWYNLNNSCVIYKNFSTLSNKQVEQYSEGIGVFKFENFNLLVMFFTFF